MSKKVLLITDVSFWNRSSGSQCRIWELVNYLHSIADLTIIYAGVADNNCTQIPYSHDAIEFIFLHEEEILGAAEYGERFEQFIYGRNFDIWIVEYIHNAYFLNYLPPGVVTVLDAHDIISERSKAFKEHNYAGHAFEMDDETEFGIMDIFDYIVLLTESDVARVSMHIDKHKLLLCPHPVKCITPIVRENVSCIGFIGSEYLPNIDAMQYFIKECWPLILKKYPHVSLTIYGNVVKALGPVYGENIVLRGYINDIDKAYNEMDIVVNPVRFGAGLKIKNVEALANGLPLITTLHGATGLEGAVNKGILVAESPADFLNCISNLIEDFSFREETGKAAFLYSTENFELEKCLAGLRQLIFPET